MELPGVKETKICPNRPDHMIDMAVMPINGKSLKIFSQEQIDRWP